MSTQTKNETTDIGDTAADRIAANVRAELAAQRISVVELAVGLGPAGGSRSALARRTSGEIPFEVDLLARVAAYLGVPLADFTRGVPAPPEKGPRPPRTKRGRDGDVVISGTASTASA